MKKQWFSAIVLTLTAACCFAEDGASTAPQQEETVIETSSPNEEAAKDTPPPQDEPSKETIAAVDEKIKVVDEDPTKPKVESFFIPAEAIEQLPKLKPLLKDDPGFNKIVFRLKNFPANKEIFLEVKRLATLTPSEFSRQMIFTIQPDGVIVTSDNKHLQAIVGSARGYLPGERVTYRFRTDDGSVSEEVSLYPQPIIARDKSGKIVLRAELTALIPTVYEIEFPTMEEGEEYEFKSTSLGEILKSKVKYEKGKPMHYMPEAEGPAKGGTSRLEIKRKSEDPYIVNLPWGTLLKSYLSGDLSYP